MASLKKVIWKLIEIWFSEEMMIDDLADCLEHYQGICSISDPQELRSIEEVIKKYENFRKLIENAKAKEKKKKWF